MDYQLVSKQNRYKELRAMAALAKVMQLTIPPGKRVICISDIHGQLDIFIQLLEKVKFCDDDILILIGDTCVGRHDNCQINKTLEYMMQLCNRTNVHAVRGNWDNAKRLPTNVDEIIKTRVTEWFESLPHIIEAQEYIFVHAGLSSNNLNEQDAGQCMLNMANDIVFEKYVVAGHCPTLNHSHKILSCNPIINTERRYILIDGALDTWGVGQLNAFIIHNGTFSHQHADNLPVVQARTAQQSSGGFSIVWTGGGEVELLKVGAEFSIYKHIQSGKIIELANNSVDIMENGTLRCSLGTDHYLPIDIGDEITVLHKFTDRVYAKKDGNIGYYKEA